MWVTRSSASGRVREQTVKPKMSAAAAFTERAQTRYTTTTSRRTVEIYGPSRRMEKNKKNSRWKSPEESAYASCRRVRSATTRRRHLGRQVCARTSVGNTTASVQIRGTDVLDSPRATPNRTHGRPPTGAHYGRSDVAGNRLFAVTLRHRRENRVEKLQLIACVQRGAAIKDERA